MIGTIPNTCITYTTPPTKLEAYLYKKLREMFNIDLDDLDGYERMVSETLKHFGKIVKLPVPSEVSINSYFDNGKPPISLSPIKIAVFEIVEVNEHPLKWDFEFKGFER